MATWTGPRAVVFTSRDYREQIHANPAFSAAFSAVLLTKALLFVGYSLSDPDFHLLMDQQLPTFDGFVPERYALMSGLGKVEVDYLWRACQIRVISYPADSHACVPQFFRQLTEGLRALTQAPAGLAGAPLAKGLRMARAAGQGLWR